MTQESQLHMLTIRGNFISLYRMGHQSEPSPHLQLRYYDTVGNHYNLMVYLDNRVGSVCLGYRCVLSLLGVKKYPSPRALDTHEEGEQCRLFRRSCERPP